MPGPIKMRLPMFRTNRKQGPTSNRYGTHKLDCPQIIGFRAVNACVDGTKAWVMHV